jgi:pSer/pThr/pTyr-binding forkhead associated (FHA) protein
MVSQQYQLVMHTGPAAGKAYGLGKSEIAIGRDPSNDIIINEVEVSRKHARLLWQDEAYVLEDLGSTNGTFVNGQHLQGLQKLQPGDTILLGENVSLIFEQLQTGADSTVAVQPRPIEAEPAPVPQYRAPQPEKQATPAPPARPAYSGQVPPGPVGASAPVMPAQPEKRSARRQWLYAGCGCLVVVILLLAVGLFAFDQLNLWCVPPFDAFGGYLPIFGYTCP